MSLDSFLDYDNYEDFYVKRVAFQSQTIRFTEDEIRWAIYETGYKYFGDYPFTDAQKAAVEILVWTAQERLK